MTKTIVEFTKVSKSLGRKRILIDVDLHVAPGEAVGIVGANGSGKTTLLRMVAGLMYPDQGNVFVDGKAVQPGLIGNLPASIGALIESPAFLPQFTGLKNLQLLAGIRGKIDQQTIRAAMERVGLNPENVKPVKAYSLGMRQRLGIAQAIMEHPDILVFDEPTNGLDQDGIEMFSEVMKDLLARGASVILVSHVMEEINRYCDRVYLLKDGSLQTLSNQRRSQWLIVARNLADLEIVFREIPSFEMGARVEGYPAGTCDGQWTTADELLQFLIEKGIQPVEIREVRQGVWI